MRAAPTMRFTASAVAAGIARAGSTAIAETNTVAAPSRNSRRFTSVPQRRQEGHHVLDLFCRQDGLAAERRRDPRQSLGSMIRRHDRRGIDAARVDDPQPELALGPAAARACEIRREVALESLLGKRSAV